MSDKNGTNKSLVVGGMEIFPHPYVVGLVDTKTGERMDMVSIDGGKRWYISPAIFAALLAETSKMIDTTVTT